MNCIICNKQIKEAIWNSTFFPNMLNILTPFIAMGVIVIILSILSTKRHQANIPAHSNKTILTGVPLTTTCLILGIGLGGFIDGIMFHQILQWHEMISNKIPPTNYVTKSVNMFWDGIFHAFCLIITIVGIVLLWKLLRRKDIDRSGNLLIGGLLSGWGLFNIAEGILDHHILKLHNVKEITSDINVWNYGFLSISTVMLLAGLIFTYRHNRKFLDEH